MNATYEGTPCRTAGHTLRYTKGGACVACLSETSKAKYQQDRIGRLAKVAAYRKANPKAIRKTHLKRYGLTEDQYYTRLASQDFKCAICRAETAQSGVTEKWFFVDHDHNTGKVRGLLCNHCNRGLGAFKDNTAFLEKAIDYLTEQVQS